MKPVQYFIDTRGNDCENCGSTYTGYNPPERHHCIVHRSKNHPELDDEINIELVCKRCHDSGVVNSQEHARGFALKQIARGQHVTEWYRLLSLKVKNEKWILELEE
jgi:hypothetical protein